MSKVVFTVEGFTVEQIEELDRDGKDAQKQVADYYKCLERDVKNCEHEWKWTSGTHEYNGPKQVQQCQKCFGVFVSHDCVYSSQETGWYCKCGKAMEDDE